VVASIFNSSAITFAAPGDALAARRLGLRSSSYIVQFGISGDSIFMGTCNVRPYFFPSCGSSTHRRASQPVVVGADISFNPFAIREQHVFSKRSSHQPYGGIPWPGWHGHYKTDYLCVLHPILHVKTAMGGVLKAVESRRFQVSGYEL
jgi:hypothetical protein